MAVKVKRVILFEVAGRKPKRFVNFEAASRYFRTLDPKANLKVTFTTK